MRLLHKNIHARIALCLCMEKSAEPPAIPASRLTGWRQEGGRVGRTYYDGRGSGNNESEGDRKVTEGALAQTENEHGK